MEQLLVILHQGQEDGLSKANLECLTAAKTLSELLGTDSFQIGLIGHQLDSVLTLLGNSGASKILKVDAPELQSPRYGSDVAAIAALTKSSGANLVLAPATTRVERCIAGACQRVGGKIDTRISGFSIEDGQLSVKRWFYRQRIEGTLTRKARPWFLTFGAGQFEPMNLEPNAATATDVEVAFSESETHTEIKGIQKPATDTQTIRPDANLLFVAGAGWSKKQGDGQIHVDQAEHLIKAFLQNSGASLGSSKSLVDQSHEGAKVLSFMSHLNQVGQTGSTPRHPKGLATCCHGEEPHVVGWRFIKERRAVNTDANCGWARGKADVVYVGDAFEVMDLVNKLLEKG